MRVLALAFIFVAGFIGSAWAADPAPSTDVFAGAGFKITLANGATATKEQGPDFDVYYVAWGAAGHLGLYEGCCPQTFLIGNDVTKADITINGLKAQELKRNDGTSVSRELRVTIPRPGTSYTMIVHAWYKSLSTADAAIADQMLSTIAPK
jgi:hypothetical protein